MKALLWIIPCNVCSLESGIAAFYSPGAFKVNGSPLKAKRKFTKRLGFHCQIWTCANNVLGHNMLSQVALDSCNLELPPDRPAKGLFQLLDHKPVPSKCLSQFFAMVSLDYGALGL